VAEGRGGVVKKFLDHTTPSARTNEASRLFLIVQPPLPQRSGADCGNFQSAPGVVFLPLQPHQILAKRSSLIRRERRLRCDLGM